MKFYFRTVFLLFIGFNTFIQAAPDKTIAVQTLNTSLLFKVGDNNKLCQSYLGKRLEPADWASVRNSNDEALLTFGTSYVHQPALRVTHADGNTSTDLIFVKSEEKRLTTTRYRRRFT